MNTQPEYKVGGLLQYIKDNPLPYYKFSESKFVWGFDELFPKFKKKENKIMKWLKKKLGIIALENKIEEQNDEINELRRKINDGAYMDKVGYYYGECLSAKTMIELILDYLKLNPVFKSCKSHYELKPYPNKNAKINTTKTVRKSSTRKK